MIIALMLILLIASIVDYKQQRIPNLLTIPAAVFALLFYCLSNGLEGFLFSLTGLVAGMGTLIIPYAMGGMGAGDVKLMGVVGSFLGVKGVCCAFLLTALYGGGYSIGTIFIYREIFKGFYLRLFHTALAFILTKKYFPDPVIEHKDKPRLCYGIAIALGTLTYMGLGAAGYDFTF